MSGTLFFQPSQRFFHSFPKNDHLLLRWLPGNSTAIKAVFLLHIESRKIKIRLQKSR